VGMDTQLPGSLRPLRFALRAKTPRAERIGQSTIHHQDPRITTSPNSPCTTHCARPRAPRATPPTTHNRLCGVLEKLAPSALIVLSGTDSFSRGNPPQMSASHRSYRIQDAASLVTALVLRRRETLLRRRARVLVRDRAAPLNLTDPRPFDRALR